MREGKRKYCERANPYVQGGGVRERVRCDVQEGARLITKERRTRRLKACEQETAIKNRGNLITEEGVSR